MKKFILTAAMAIALFSCNNNGEVENDNGVGLKITSGGFGGVKNSAVWVKCKGHKRSTKLMINNKVLSTTYYEDHLTAKLPTENFGSSSVTVQLKDSTINMVSDDFEISK